jgi:predicted O-methyltransferase YrrM
MGLATVLGLGRRGFFIPYRYAGTVPAPGGRAPYDGLADRFRDAEASFRDVLATIDRFATDLEAIGVEPPAAPRWGQDWFPRLDAAAAYALVRHRAPARIVEVGAGHSTRFLASAVVDGGLATRITAIDPAPRPDLEALGVEVRATTLQEAGLDAFADLAAGDVLSIDSSHVLMPGSDVDVLLNVVLPSLAAGVVVQFHDILLPDDYPEEWDWRGYNEQLGVAPLVHGGGYRLLWSSHYVTSRMAGELAGTVVARLPIEPGARETSLWLSKR